MNVFSNLVKDNAIIGIGPLMFEQSANQANYILYGSCRYYFMLHLEAHSIQISSDWFSPNTHPEHKELILQWRTQYFRHRKEIAQVIGVDLVEEIYTHEQKVKAAFEQVKEDLIQLIADLQPGPHNHEDIMALQSKILEGITELKKLAGS